MGMRQHISFVSLFIAVHNHAREFEIKAPSFSKVPAEDLEALASFAMVATEAVEVVDPCSQLEVLPEQLIRSDHTTDLGQHISNR